MAQITLEGNPFNTVGDLPAVGSKAPDFTLTNTDLADATLQDFAGKKVVLNIFPSLDTPVCADSIRRFNQEAAAMDNAVVLCISADLPFAFARFCGTEGIENVVSLSVFKSPAFGKDYGVGIEEGVLAGLLSRAVVIVDEQGNVIYTEQVPEIAQEPDYAAALAAIK
ncbi:MAG: thiol peroxidase [Gammaproteobacteria bacterium]|jgi:thioredoxin-dependent peroxiredoxin